MYTYAGYTATCSSFASGEGIGNLGGALVFSGPAMTATAVGNYAITPGGWTSSNYDIHYSNGQLSITPVTMNLKVMLQGPYNTGTGLMNTDLMTAVMIPANQPFNVFPWNYAGTETAPTPPATTVDWVLVELRSDVNTMVGRAAGLLNSDGTISLNINNVTFPAIHAGSSYYVVVWHRNHMPLMSATALAMPLASCDFTDITHCYASGAIKVKTSPDVYAMIAGDITQNGSLRYSGPNNDRGPVIARIVAQTGSNNINGSTAAGYWQEDATLNGIVLYTGDGNDRSVILSNLGILTGNGYLNSTYTSVVPMAYTGGKSALAGGYADIQFNESANSLSIDLLSRQNVQNGMIDNIQFTLAWNAGDAGMADLLSHFTSSFNLLPQGKALELNGIMYQAFVSVTPVNLPQNWIAGDRLSVMNFSKMDAGSIGSRLWIGNNEFVTLNNGEYYVSNQGNDVTGSVVETTTGTNNFPAVNSMEVFPNPVNSGRLFLQISTDRNENLEAQLWDMSGKLMQKAEISTLPGKMTFKMDVSGFPAGVYLLNVVGGNTPFSTRFVIQ